jgi:hypothetical protein
MPRMKKPLAERTLYVQNKEEFAQTDGSSSPSGAKPA